MFEDGNLWPDAFRIKWFSLVVFEKEFFLVWQGQYFFGNVLSVLFSISGGSETNLKSSWFCQMNFNFNFNLVERWNSFIVNWFNPPTHKPLNKIFNWFLSVQIYWRKQLKYCQNPNLTTTQRKLNLRLGLTWLLLFTPLPPPRNSTSTRNNGPSGLKFCMQPHLTKPTTTQHNFNPTVFWGGRGHISYPLG